MNDTMRRTALICLLPVAMSWTWAALGGNATQTNPSTWTVDDVLSVEWASNLKISPDCHWAVWVKSVPDKDKNGWVGNLYLSSLTEAKEIQLTRGSEGGSNPKWSPDGQRIAFLSSRPDPKAKADDKTKAQVWLIATESSPSRWPVPARLRSAGLGRLLSRNE